MSTPDNRTAGTLIDNALRELEAAKTRLGSHADQTANIRLHRAIAGVKEVLTALPAEERSLTAIESEAEATARVGDVEQPATDAEPTTKAKAK